MTTGDASDEPVDPFWRELDDLFGAAREERRTEEEEYTKAAARQWARRRDLLDVARELQHRGDTISLRVGDVVFIGLVEAVGRDYLRLRTDSGCVDVALFEAAGERAPRPLLLRVVERARSGGQRMEPGAQTFRARLLEYDGEEIDVVLGSHMLGEELRGRVVVGRDHVVVHDRDGGETYLPIAHASWVRAWRD